MELWLIWLIAIIILAIIELSTSSLVCIWFIASALISLIISLFYDSLYLGIGVFTIVGVLLLITTRKILNKFLKNKNDVKTNLERIIGDVGVVTQMIDNDEIGEVKVDGKRWSAISEEKINVGEKVIIESINSVKLKVRKVM